MTASSSCKQSLKTGGVKQEKSVGGISPFEAALHPNPFQFGDNIKR